MASVSDYKLAALAAGFSIGFGVLTLWEAIKQTRRNRNPLRSVYIYMLWGELAANVAIGILGWLLLDRIVGPTPPVLLFILVFWVLEIQLLMQIIINRIALIVEHRSTLKMIKWGTVIFITLINISVFVIWIPAHLAKPLPTFVKINNVWDKITKVLILLVDSGLNWYFLRIVKIRLLKQHRLMKYKPLVGFNAKLMVLSVAMDGMLIGLMFLKNPIVYIQFHPVAYLVKLNIEMSMASLITHVARGTPENDMNPDPFIPYSDSKTKTKTVDLQYAQRHAHVQGGNEAFGLSSMKGSKYDARGEPDESADGIYCHTELNVVVEQMDPDSKSLDGKKMGSSRSSHEARHSMFGDETPLRKIQGADRQAY